MQKKWVRVRNNLESIKEHNLESIKAIFLIPKEQNELWSCEARKMIIGNHPL